MNILAKVKRGFSSGDDARFDVSSRDHSSSSPDALFDVDDSQSSTGDSVSMLSVVSAIGKLPTTVIGKLEEEGRKKKEEYRMERLREKKRAEALAIRKPTRDKNGEEDLQEEDTDDDSVCNSRAGSGSSLPSLSSIFGMFEEEGRRHDQSYGKARLRDMMNREKSPERSGSRKGEKKKKKKQSLNVLDQLLEDGMEHEKEYIKEKHSAKKFEKNIIVGSRLKREQRMGISTRVGPETRGRPSKKDSVASSLRSSANGSSARSSSLNRLPETRVVVPKDFRPRSLGLTRDTSALKLINTQV